MLIKRAQEIRSSEITDPRTYMHRRSFMAGAAAVLLAPSAARAAAPPPGQALQATPSAAFRIEDAPTKFESATTYNNFYEFGVDKADPSQNAGSFRTRPWTMRVEGFVARPKTYDIDELIRLFPLEERVYRLR
ncbi:MAG: mononuclear molybdenum enzyme YedY, partial [Candidatus Rokuibacteriota bacterium]